VNKIAKILTTTPS